MEPQNIDARVVSTDENSATAIMWSPPANLESFDLDYYNITVILQSDMSVVVQANVTDESITLTLPQNGDYVAEITAVNMCGQASSPATSTFVRGE